VLSPVQVDTSGGEIVTRIQGLARDRSEARLLRAIEVVLNHDRLVTVTNTATGAGEVIIDLSLQSSPGAVDDPYITLETKYGDTIPADFIPLVTGEATDSGRESIRLATIYFLSYPGAEEGSDPDVRWEAHVRHRVQWNLQFVTQQRVETIEPTRVELPVPGLVGGALGAIGGPLVAAINDNLETMENAFRSVENRGRFLMI
jgi:hypothetical protein